MYKKWIEFTEQKPYATIVIIAIIGSVIGITIEYLLNKNFNGNGFYVTLIFVFGQIILIKRKQKRQKNSKPRK
ncbi:hypothetical protein ACFQOY_06955 [Enterococcus alcedinis]|uniref:Uncharacterized protein n=1 Tax=Enterococcus alcedinis TaxID=1274384 RepID=A0A917JIC3_9ENTE|nr:hypothetical protein [Enterococcus alcedinis]MBP2102861.1 putative membrane protein YfcA [Enterococcus alcedinis]GGI66477.1 hypothetical protein GCM10011482_21310 [Enterococcus alcedinis]